MIGILLFESVKQQIYGIFERFIIFPDFHCVYHLYECRKILLIFWSFIIDVADQSRVKKRLGLHPKIIAGFAFPFRIGNQHRNQFENVFLAMDIREWIVVHRLPKVNRIEHFDLIRLINDFAFFIAVRSVAGKRILGLFYCAAVYRLCPAWERPAQAICRIPQGRCLSGR